MQLCQFMDVWLESHVIGLRPATEECYRGILKLIKANAQTMELSDISPLSAPMLWAPQLRKGQTRSAQLIFVLLKMALNSAVFMHILPENPLNFIKKPRKEQTNVRYLSTFEAKKLLKTQSAFRPAYALALLAGLRRGEIAALRWSCLCGRNLTVEATRAYIGGESIEGPPKSSAGRRILPISDNLLSILRAANLEQRKYCFENGLPWSPESAYIVSTKGGAPVADPRQLTHALRADLKANSLPAVSFHSLRHSYAAAAVAAGVEMRVLQSLLGHESIQTTAKFYAHVSELIMLNANKAISNTIT